MRSILAVMAAVAIAFIVVIWFGFWIHSRTSAIPDNVFGVVAYVAIFGITPVERAMRTAGIDVRFAISASLPIIKAACRIHEAELRRVFQLPPPVYYREDNPRADIICGYCLKSDSTRCDILVLHPSECREDAPWFPSRPGS